MRPLATVLPFACTVLFACAGCDTHIAPNTPELSLERMINQRRFQPFDPNPLFPDDAAMRPIPEGTVARGAPVGRVTFETGLEGGKPVTQIPLPLTRALLLRGRERFEIFCAPCHGVTGTGQSVVATKVQLVRPPSLVSDRIQQFPPGRIFRVLQEGYGLMPSYAPEISIQDRWAIVAYVHALGLSRGVALDALPPTLRREAEEALR